MPALCGRAFDRCAVLERRLGAAASDHTVQAVLQAQLSRGAAACSIVVPSCWDWLRSELVNAAQDVGEQIAGYRDFGQLERHVATMAYSLGADLDELPPQLRLRLTLDLLRLGQ